MLEPLHNSKGQKVLRIFSILLINRIVLSTDLTKLARWRELRVLICQWTEKDFIFLDSLGTVNGPGFANSYFTETPRDIFVSVTKTLANKRENIYFVENNIFYNDIVINAIPLGLHLWFFKISFNEISFLADGNN